MVGGGLILSLPPPSSFLLPPFASGTAPQPDSSPSPPHPPSAASPAGSGHTKSGPVSRNTRDKIGRAQQWCRGSGCSSPPHTRLVCGCDWGVRQEGRQQRQRRSGQGREMEGEERSEEVMKGCSVRQTEHLVPLVLEGRGKELTESPSLAVGP